MLFFLLAVGAGVTLWAVFTFNGLVRLRNQFRTAGADVDVQLQRRHDLVPRLVDVVKAYSAHERTTLEAVTKLRLQAQKTHGVVAQGQTEHALSTALVRLIALQEAYPDLKANQNFMQLSSALVDVENTLQYARRFYNGAVRDYNDAIQRFPALLIAGVFQFPTSDFFQADANAQPAPIVELS